tara:strand:+ start:443 stop:880 length:438 start_codon:yes stop_codon:yes gene_type:complete
MNDITKLYHNGRGTVSSYDTDGQLIGTIGQAEDVLNMAGLASTYWGKKIIAAEKRGKFTASNRQHAADWVTCACGRVTGDIPREPCLDEDSHSYNLPLDSLLKHHGFNFYDNVEEGRFLAAAETLVSIEARAITVAKAYLQEQRA